MNVYKTKCSVNCKLNLSGYKEIVLESSIMIDHLHDFLKQYHLMFDISSDTTLEKNIKNLINTGELPVDYILIKSNEIW